MYFCIININDNNKKQTKHENEINKKTRNRN
jgi:hypothetical protein